MLQTSSSPCNQPPTLPEPTQGTRQHPNASPVREKGARCGQREGEDRVQPKIAGARPDRTWIQDRRWRLAGKRHRRDSDGPVVRRPEPARRDLLHRALRPRAPVPRLPRHLPLRPPLGSDNPDRRTRKRPLSAVPYPLFVIPGRATARTEGPRRFLFACAGEGKGSGRHGSRPSPRSAELCPPTPQPIQGVADKLSVRI